MSYNFIGRAVPRTDNTDKVTGAARYTSDVILPGTLWAKTLRSPYSHARIKRIDTSRAERAPGVRAVLTGNDVRGILYGRRYRDISILAQDRVRFLGERVAAVAAETLEQAENALDLIEIEYEELPAVFDPIAAFLTWRATKDCPSRWTARPIASSTICLPAATWKPASSKAI